jgi:hypothetical protein
MSKHARETEEIVRGFVLKDTPEVASYLELTPREKVFCEEYLSNGYNRAKAAFKAVNTYGEPSPHPLSKSDYWAREGYKLMAIKRVHTYIQAHIKMGEIKLGKPLTVESVTQVIGDILYDGTLEPRDRLKAGEILLKHLGGFTKHNESRAPKQLTVINGMSPKELEDELALVLAGAKSLQELKDLEDQNNNIEDAQIDEQ